MPYTPNHIPLSQARAVLSELHQMGYSNRDLFKGAGVSPLYPAESCNSLPAVEFTRLYSYAFRLLEAQTSLRSEPQPVRKEVTDMLCYCAISARTLLDSIQRISTFTSVVNQKGASITLQQGDQRSQIVIDMRRNSRNTASLLITLGTMNMLHQLLSWLIGQRIQLDTVALEYAQHPQIAPAKTLPTSELLYSQPHNSLSFSSHYLALPMIRSYGDLEEVLDYFPFDISFSNSSSQKLATRIRMLITTALQQQLTLPKSQALAKLFYLSDSSLRRRLKEEGSSFSTIRTECQREYAEQLLIGSGDDIATISAKLGFNNDRSFRRAFKGWHRCSPSEYRDRHKQADEEQSD